MSIADVLSDAIHEICDHLIDDLGQLNFEFEDKEWIYTQLMPVLTQMNALVRVTDTLDEPGDPLTCVPCQRAFPDVLQLMRHLRTSPAHDPAAADVAMAWASQRPDVAMAVRGDLMSIQEVSMREASEGLAVITDVEGYVVSIPADCSHCQEIRETFVEHIRDVHPTPTAEPLDGDMD